ncbi:hypothetical protein VHEMI07636 [[Torrubiella] hemipterigena]|uniref:Uncharacterized protein n=1 Tax=[Torrubiella] hemipterigena TaxID=1531966 RepID=A0A0A1TLP7_9HYPO|nr:hypothetical protein VHEMI07636 [[Torrubiella] hemipterigena]
MRFTWFTLAGLVALVAAAPYNNEKRFLAANEMNGGDDVDLSTGLAVSMSLRILVYQIEVFITNVENTTK